MGKILLSTLYGESALNETVHLEVEDVIIISNKSSYHVLLFLRIT